MSSIKKTAQININVGLDENGIPAKMEWQADGQALQPCKAMLLSLFDETSKDTLKIDLWTKEMQVVEMDRFFFQTLRALADTYFKATQNQALAADMQRFVQYFGEKTEILPKQ
ncbi:MAG: gliding motility protein GldC [Saprospiraceae bacterium]|nr:gliding motility protein GldC [Saprospiraceae bacterium]